MTPPALTVCLLNWQRPAQLRMILDALALQRPRPVIFLWNNSPLSFQHPAVDWHVESSRNLVCLPRWWMAAQADTPFVASLDDDVLPLDQDVLADAVAVAAEQPADRAVGPYGANFITGSRYYPHMPISCPDEDQGVDIVKGRCLIVHRESLMRVRFDGVEGLSNDGDDINICGTLAAGRPGYHLVPKVFHGRMKDLPQGPESLCLRENHLDRRHAAYDRWYGGTGG